jgi:hypothetical protein
MAHSASKTVTAKKAPTTMGKTSAAPSWKENGLYLGLLCLIFLMSYVYIFDKKLDLNGDNFGYLNYAKAILDGKGYVSPYSPDYAPTNWFPPGYSALLATLMAVFGQNIVLFKIVNGVFYLAAILLVFFIAHRVTGNKPLAFTVSALLFLNSGLMRYATILMSEIPYLLLSTLAIYALLRLEDEIQLFKNKWFWLLVLGSVGAFYFRSVALGLVGGVLLFFAFRKEWKRAGAYVAGFALLYLPWFIRDHVHGLKSRYFNAMTVANAWRPEEGHIQTVGGYVDKMVTNFQDTVIKGFTEVLFPFVKVVDNSSAALYVAGILIVAMAFFGAWKTGKYRVFFVGYLLANIGVFLLWHSGNGSRYVWPVAPFIGICFFWGLYQVVTFVLRKWKVQTGVGVAFAFLAVGFLLQPKMKELHEMAVADYLPAYKNYFDMAKAVKEHGNKNMMVCCRKAEMFHYFSGTYVNTYEFSLDDRKVLEHMVRTNVDLVVLEQLGYSSTYRYLYPAIVKHPDLFQPVMHLTDPDTYLLAFNKEGARRWLAGAPAAQTGVPAAQK